MALAAGALAADASAKETPEVIPTAAADSKLFLSDIFPSEKKRQFGG